MQMVSSRGALSGKGEVITFQSLRSVLVWSQYIMEKVLGIGKVAVLETGQFFEQASSYKSK